MAQEERFSFRWGIPWLDEGFTTIPNFMFRHYTQVGVTRAEFLTILHLASYHYECADGQASPSLVTLAKEMGYGDSSGLRHHIRSLESKGMLTRHLRCGNTSIYVLRGFSRKILAAYLNSQRQETLSIDSHPPLNRFTDSLLNSSHQTTKQEQQTTDDGDDSVPELAQRLIDLGVHRGEAIKWARRRTPAMILGWLEYLRRNGDGLSNVPGFLVSKLKAGEEPPAMERVEDDRRRYIDGPYAHLIEH